MSKNTPQNRVNILNKHFGENVELHNDVVILRKFINDGKIQPVVSYFNSVKNWEPMSPALPQGLQDYTALKYFISDPQLDQYVFDMTKHILNVFCVIYPQARLLVRGDQSYRLNRYSGGRSYYPHVDCHAESKFHRERAISCVIQLNSEYEGGLLKFPHQELEVKLLKGDVALFPAAFTHPHSVDPVTSGERHNMVTWFT
jgi:hypothetical protein